MDQCRRQAALHFLRNISLDGRPPQGFVGGLLGAEDGSEVTMSTQQHHSSITTAIVHSSGAGDQTQSDNAGTSLTSGQGSMNFEAPAASASLRKQAYSSSDSQSSSSLGLQRTRRKLTVQRFETLQGIDENVPLHRYSSTSSPQPKSSKRVHFIKNMRQHDTGDGRIILISIRRALCCVFSLIPYRNYSHIGDVTLETGHQHLSGSIAAKEKVIGLEGVELGAKGKTVSYSELLYATYVLSKDSHMGQCSSSGLFYPAAPCGFHPVVSVSPHCKGTAQPWSSHSTLRTTSGAGNRDCVDYDPSLLDDPHWQCGKHKRVLVFPSYMTTVIEYTKPSDLKKDMNETFREKFPHIQLTLSKIRSLKKEIRKLAEEDCGYEEPTVAMAFVYFEKLALRGKLDKQNRKLCAGACILLAAKIGNDLKRFEVKQLIDRLEERLRLNRRDLLTFEFSVLVALEFYLHLPDRELLPHYRRLLQTT